MSDSSISKHKPTNFDIPSIDDKDFPSLYQSADKAAIEIRRKYFCFRLWHLVCLILGSVVAVLGPRIPETFLAWLQINPETFLAWLQISIAGILVVGVLINIIPRVRKYDETWFECRAIAESTKTAAWRFMMKASPFEEDSTAEETFISKVSEIRKGRASILRTLVQYQNPDTQLITKVMKEIRQKDIENQKSRYLSSRLLNQKNWYWKKSYSNSIIESRLFYTTMVLQFFAIISAIIQCVLSMWSVNLVPILMTLAAALIAWNQMKRHSELAQSYALMAQELEELETGYSSLTQESDFCKFVNDVEYAISREHTMWCVRREVAADPNNQE